MCANLAWRPWLSTLRRSGILVRLFLFAVAIGNCYSLALCQSNSLSSGSRRPFVTGLIPVIGRGGAVGGVSVDAAGVVARSDTDMLGQLRDLRSKALGKINGPLTRTSTLRKISLRGIVEEITRRRLENKSISDDLQYLAGLQRVEYVFVYPDQNDIVLAGFAEGCKVDAGGNIVGQSTDYPVLQLDDLIIALRTARSAATGEGITCSIDPTEEGTKRL